MSDGEKVVYLAARTDKATTEWRENLACKGCHNKTFAIEYDMPREVQPLPVVRCACCGALLGRIGWADTA